MNELSKLIELAKGKDRSIREYANEAGVNSATVSRAIKGDITPSIKMLKKLTSDKAKPRNGITFESLHAAASMKEVQVNKENYALAMGALTAGAISTIFNPFAMLPVLAGTVTVKAVSASKSECHEEDNGSESVSHSERIEKYKKQQELFSATAMGILYGALAKKEISFCPDKLEAEDTNGYGEEKVIRIENQDIRTWKFNFFSLIENDIEINTMVENMVTSSIQTLIFTKPNKEKKVSVVVKDRELFEHVKDICVNISYRGNFSVILIDLDNICVAEEVMLASYELHNSIEKMKLKD